MIHNNITIEQMTSL